MIAMTVYLRNDFDRSIGGTETLEGYWVRDALIRTEHLSR